MKLSQKIKNRILFIFKLLIYRNPVYRKWNQWYWQRHFNQEHTSTNSQLQSVLKLHEKKILIVVAHMDDELIFGAALLASPYARCKLIVATDGGEGRVTALTKICKERAIEFEYIHDTYEASEFSRDEYFKRDLNDSQKTKLKEFLESAKQEQWDMVVTHNAWGEYGNGQHSAVHRLVNSFFNPAQLFYFTFSEIYKHRGDQNVIHFPHMIKEDGCFRGIFQHQQTGAYYFLDTNQAISNPDMSATLQLRSYYKGFETWPMTADSALDQFLREPVCYLYNPAIQTQFLEHEVDAPVRSFLDNYLLEYIKFNFGTLCWIGWDKMCEDHNYQKRFAPAKLITIDKKQRGDIQRPIDFVGDMIDLHGIVADDSFDTLIMNGVLEYVDDMSKAISEMARITKKGGRCLLGTPGATWTETGKNRPTKKFLQEELQKYFNIIELWNINTADYHYVLLLKK